MRKKGLRYLLFYSSDEQANSYISVELAQAISKEGAKVKFQGCIVDEILLRVFFQLRPSRNTRPDNRG